MSLSKFICKFRVFLPLRAWINAEVAENIRERDWESKPHIQSLNRDIYRTPTQCTLAAVTSGLELVHSSSSPLKSLINCYLRNARWAHCGHSTNVHLLETKSYTTGKWLALILSNVGGLNKLNSAALVAILKSILPPWVHSRHIDDWSLPDVIRRHW